MARRPGSTAPSAWRQGSFFFPSPLVGEGGSRRLTGEGFRPIDRKRPLTQLNVKLLPVMPSPTRGEGTIINAAIRWIRKTRKKVRKETKWLWETRHEWECSCGFDKTGLSQDRMAGTRYRGRAAARRRHRPEVAGSAEGL